MKGIAESRLLSLLKEAKKKKVIGQQWSKEVHFKLEYSQTLNKNKM